MFKNYILTAFRNLIRQRVYSLINITGLALGLAACAVLFLWIHYHLSFDNFHEKSDRIYRPIINTSTPGLNEIHHCGSPGIFTDLFNLEFPEIEKTVRLYRPRQATRLRINDKVSDHYNIYWTDPSFFNIFTFPLKYGNIQTALQDPGSIVLSAKVAHALFGNDNPVGQFIQMNDQSQVKVTGVLQPIPDHSHLQFDFLVPYNPTWLTKYNQAHPMDSDFLAYLLIKPETDIQAIEIRMPAMLTKYYPEVAENVNIYFQQMDKIHLHSAHITYSQWSWRTTDIKLIYLFAAVAILILAIACINYINLTTARAARRAREIGIRKTIGSTRLQVILQFLGESVLITTLAVVLSRVLIQAGMPLLNNLFRGELNLSGLNTFELTGWMLGFGLIIGLMTGWYPAMMLSFPNPQSLFKPKHAKSARGFSLRRLLVVIQFCITMILIIFSFTIGKQLTYIQNQSLGFNKDQVLSIKMPDNVGDNFETIKHQLLEQSAVTEVTAMGPHNFAGFQGKTFEFEGQMDDQWWSTSCSGVDFNFIEFMDMTIVEGRGFFRQFESDANRTYVINESLKRKLGWETAVGKRFRIPEHQNETGIVIGVVKDFNFRSLHQPVEGCALFLKPDTLNQMMIRANANQFPDVMKKAREIWKQYAPESVFQYFFLDGHFDHQYRSERNARNVINVFSIWALFVAGIGLLGLISYSTEQRSKEIGLRKVLGASVGGVMLLFTREYLILLTISVAVAWPLSWMLVTQWLNGFAYRTTIGPGIYLLAWAMTLMTAGLIISIQLIKVATANPVNSLRYE